MSIVDSDSRVVVLVPLDVLENLFEPFAGTNPWTGEVLTREMVSSAIEDRRFNSVNPFWTCDPNVDDSTTAHVERIAYLVEFGWPETDFMHVEVDGHGGAHLMDGNHRLYALAYLGERRGVPVEVSGFMDAASEVLGVSV